MHNRPDHAIECDESLSSDSASSLELVRLACKGDRSALDALFERHLPRLHRWATGRLPSAARHHADTTDLVQETALHVFKRLPYFEVRHRGALQAYLRQAITNRLSAEYRRSGRAPGSVELTEDLPDDRNRSPLDMAIDAETRRRYQDALATLRSDEQQGIVARVEMGYSYEQIALLLDKPSADAARKMVTRALARLAERMDRA